MSEFIFQSVNFLLFFVTKRTGVNDAHRPISLESAASAGKDIHPSPAPADRCTDHCEIGPSFVPHIASWPPDNRCLENGLSPQRSPKAPRDDHTDSPNPSRCV